MNRRVWPTILLGMLLFAPFQANAAVTGDYLIAQCSAELGDLRVKTKSYIPERNMTNFESQIRYEAQSNVASLSLQSLKGSMQEFEKAWAAYLNSNGKNQPTYPAELANYVYGVCIRRAALVANGGSARSSTPAPFGSRGAMATRLSPARTVPLTANYLLSQCNAEVTALLTSSNLPGSAAANRGQAEAAARQYATFDRKTLSDRFTGGTQLLANYQNGTYQKPDPGDLAYAKMALCYARVGLAGFDNSSPAPSASPAAKSKITAAPAPLPRATGPAPARALSPRSPSSRYPSLYLSPEQERGMKVLDDELARFEKGAREYVQETEGKDAKGCVGIVWGGYYDGAKLINTCSFPIEAIWCVDGVDCKPTFSNQNTLGITPSSYSYAMGTSKEGYGRLVRYGACVAGDDIEYRNVTPFQYRCKVRRK